MFRVVEARINGLGITAYGYNEAFVDDGEFFKLTDGKNTIPVHIDRVDDLIRTLQAAKDSFK